jgi:hypothetical protein
MKIDRYKIQPFKRLNKCSTKDINTQSYYKWHDDVQYMWFIGSAGVFYSYDLLIVTEAILNDWQGHNFKFSYKNFLNDCLV